MDKSTILAMEAGEELDKLVAVEVMEELMPEFTPQNALDLQLAGSPVKSPKGNWLCLCRYDGGDIPMWQPVPFSTDISAAWQVVEKLNADIQDLFVTVCRSPNGHCDVSISQRANPLADSFAPSMPEAICKAALLTRLEVK